MNANGILTVVFGWVPSFATSVWNWFSGKQDGGLFAWLAEHWKSLVLAIALIALVVDLAVYLIRWRPYRVWISFFRRLRQPARPSDPEVYWERRVPEPLPEPPIQPQEPEPTETYQPVQDNYPEAAPVYGVTPETATYTPPAASSFVPYVSPDPDEPTYTGDAWVQPEPEQTYVPLVYRDIPAEPAAWTGEDTAGYGEPEEYDEAEADPGEPQPRVRRSAGKRPAGRNTVGGLIRSMTAGDEEQPHMRYQAPQPAMDSEDAYNAPYIPPQWQDPGNAGTGMVRHRRAQP